MKTLDKFITRAMDMVIVVSMVLMVIMVFGNVVLRYVFNSGISASEELARFCFLWLIFVGSVVVMRERGHLGVDSLIARLSRPKKIACVLTSNALMLWICYLFFVGSWRQTVIGWETLAPATGIPMAFHYGVGLIMSFGIGLIVLHNSWRILSGKATDDELVQIIESEDVPESGEKTAPESTQNDKH